MFDHGLEPYIIACENIAETMAEHPDYNLENVCATFGIFDPTPAEMDYIMMRIAEHGG